MKNTNGLFLVITDSSLKVQYLNSHVRYVCYTRISWERQENRNRVIQCRRCQQWGHGTKNCHANPKCVKCSEAHWSRECNLVRKDDPTTAPFIKCANCKGPHLAMSNHCPTYRKRLEILERQRLDGTKKHATRAPAKISYIPAPIPSINAWNHKRNQLPLSRVAGNIATQSSEIPQNMNRLQNHNSGDNFNSLVSEFIELDSLINMNRMISLVRSLNAALRKCVSELDKFQTFNSFCLQNFGADKTVPSQCRP